MIRTRYYGVNMRFTWYHMAKQCELDWLVKRASDVLAPVIVRMCNASFSQTKLRTRSKIASVRRTVAEEAHTGPERSGSRVFITGRLHGTIVGPTGRSDWSVLLVGPTIVSCKRFVRPVGQTVGRIKHVWFRPTANPTVEACGHYVRLVGPTGQSDDQSRCSVGGTCCLRHSYIAAAVIYTSGG